MSVLVPPLEESTSLQTQKPHSFTDTDGYCPLRCDIMQTGTQAPILHRYLPLVEATVIQNVSISLSDYMAPCPGRQSSHSPLGEPRTSHSITVSTVISNSTSTFILAHHHSLLITQCCSKFGRGSIYLVPHRPYHSLRG
jgi:hypothetical protein